MAQSFASPEEEIQFWKDKAAVLEKEAKEIKEEFQEFQEGSRELELELETQLEQSEAKIKEFRSLTNRLQHENEQLKDKLEQCHKEYHFQVMLGTLSRIDMLDFLKNFLQVLGYLVPQRQRSFPNR